MSEDNYIKSIHKKWYINDRIYGIKGPYFFFYLFKIRKPTSENVYHIDYPNSFINFDDLYNNFYYAVKDTDNNGPINLSELKGKLSEINFVKNIYWNQGLNFDGWITVNEFKKMLCQQENFLQKNVRDHECNLNDDSFFYIKYLKYKQKYLSLKKKMIGGGSESKNEIPSITNTPLFSCYHENSFDRLIETANNNNLLIDSIDNLDNWNVKSLDSVEFKIDDTDIRIDFEMLHYGDKSDINPIFIIPGFSNSSLTMTVGRINRFKNTILEKGYSDIYIMNNTSIGKLPNNLANKGVSFPTTYKAICNNISSYFDSYEKVTLLGRSAGGGIAMYLAFKFISEKVIGLNLACPGYDMSDMGATIDSFENKNLPIRVSWASSDSKIVENIENVSGGQSLKKRFEKNNYTNFKYYQVDGLLEEGPSIEGKNKHINTHRIQPILIDNLV